MSSFTRSRRSRIPVNQSNIRGSGSLPNLNMRRAGSIIYTRDDGLPDIITLNPLDFLPSENDNFINHINSHRAGEKRRLVLMIVELTLFVCIAAISMPIPMSTMIENVYAKLNGIVNTALIPYTQTVEYFQDDHSVQKGDEHYLEINKQLQLLHYELKYLKQFLDSNLKFTNDIKGEIDILRNYTLLENRVNLKTIDSRIYEALSLYDADKMGTIDYALETAGGVVTSIPATVPYPSQAYYAILGLLNFKYDSNPHLIIQAGTLPGQCFAFHGNKGRIRIQLSHTIHITGVTMEHVHPNLVADMTSAPRDFRIYGLRCKSDDTGYSLGNFTYKLETSPLQTFHVTENLTSIAYGHVELYIVNNHGNMNYTCIYRFRVHGRKVSN